MSDEPLVKLRGSVRYIVDWFVERHEINETEASTVLRGIADYYESRGERQ